MRSTVGANQDSGLGHDGQSIALDYMRAQDEQARYKNQRKSSSRHMVLADSTLRKTKTKMARMSNADLEDLGGAAGRNTDLGPDMAGIRGSPVQPRFKATGGSVFKGANRTTGTGRLAVNLSPRAGSKKSPGGSEERASLDINEEVEEDPVGEAESPQRPPNETQTQVN